MKKISSVFLLLLVLLTPLDAAPNPTDAGMGTPLAETEKKAVIEHLNGLQKNINSITAKASQIKKTNLLKKELRSEGAVSLKKPNFMRWEINKPEKTITAVDGEKMTIYRPKAKEAELYDLSENIIARNAINFFSSSINMSLDELEKKFSVNIYRTSDNFVFELKPKSKMTSKYLEVIYIWYNKKNGLPSEFEVISSNSDKTHTWLTDIVVNPDLSPDMFRLTLPDEVWITNKVSPAASN